MQKLVRVCKICEVIDSRIEFVSDIFQKSNWREKERKSREKTENSAWWAEVLHKIWSFNVLGGFSKDKDRNAKEKEDWKQTFTVQRWQRKL